MEHRVAKISLLVMCIGAIAWLGAINVRGIIGGELLQFGTLEFRPNIHPMVERAIFGIMAKSSIVVLLAYLVTITSSIVFLKHTTLSLKQHGWLMMSAILFYIFVPVELYTSILDGQMIYLDLSSSSDLVEFRKLFIHRLGALSGVPIIALMCYYTIVGLVIIQPLKRRYEVSDTHH